MLIYKCDRCKKEQEEDKKFVEVELILECERYDLCEECAEELKQFLKELQ